MCPNRSIEFEERNNPFREKLLRVLPPPVSSFKSLFFSANPIAQKIHELSSWQQTDPREIFLTCCLPNLSSLNACSVPGNPVYEACLVILEGLEAIDAAKTLRILQSLHQNELLTNNNVDFFLDLADKEDESTVTFFLDIWKAPREKDLFWGTAWTKKTMSKIQSAECISSFYDFVVALRELDRDRIVTQAKHFISAILSEFILTEAWGSSALERGFVVEGRALAHLPPDMTIRVGGNFENINYYYDVAAYWQAQCTRFAAVVSKLPNPLFFDIRGKWRRENINWQQILCQSKSPATLSFINFNFNNLSIEQLQSLEDTVTQAGNLCSLFFLDCGLNELTPEKWHIFLKILSKAQKLTRFTLNHEHSFSNERVLDLVLTLSGLPVLTSVECLLLSGYRKLTDVETERLSTILTRLSHLQNLSLGPYSFDLKLTLWTKICATLQDMRNLKSLNLFKGTTLLTNAATSAIEWAEASERLMSLPSALASQQISEQQVATVVQQEDWTARVEALNKIQLRALQITSTDICSHTTALCQFFLCIPCITDITISMDYYSESQVINNIFKFTQAFPHLRFYNPFLANWVLNDFEKKMAQYEKRPSPSALKDILEYANLLLKHFPEIDSITIQQIITSQLINPQLDLIIAFFHDLPDLSDYTPLKPAIVPTTRCHHRYILALNKLNSLFDIYHSIAANTHSSPLFKKMFCENLDHFLRLSFNCKINNGEYSPEKTVIVMLRYLNQVIIIANSLDRNKVDIDFSHIIQSCMVRREQLTIILEKIKQQKTGLARTTFDGFRFFLQTPSNSTSARPTSNSSASHHCTL